VTLADLDRLLADWQQRIEVIAQNLTELDGLPTYQRLAGTSGYPQAQLTGISAARVAPALEAMGVLFQHFGLLAHTVEQASALRKQLSWFWPASQKLHDIIDLLTGPSIQLPEVHVDLAHRDLLTAAATTQMVTPEQLLAAMTHAFEVVKNTIYAVDSAWQHLEPQLARVDAEIQELQILAETLDMRDLAELLAARQQLRALRGLVDNDPLAARADLDGELTPLLVQARTTLQQRAAQRTQLHNDMLRARTLLERLRVIHQQATEALAESQVKVVTQTSPQPPMTQETLEALAQWLQRLERTWAEGHWVPVRVGIHNWLARAQACLALEEQVAAACRAPLELRQELRGRLQALKAKAVACGLAEEAALVSLAEQATQLLYMRPTPVDRAAELVAAYEARLQSRPPAAFPLAASEEHHDGQ